MRKSVSLLVIMLISFSLNTMARQWTNTSGKKINATFVSVEGDKVLLKKKRGSKIYKVPINSLSQDDQEYIKKLESEKAEKLKQAEADLAEKNAKAMIINGITLKSGQINHLKGIPIDPKWHKTDGRTTFNAAVILPPKFDPTKKYTLVQVFIAGKGNAISMLNGHMNIAQQSNCVVFAIDNSNGKSAISYYDFYKILNTKWKVKDNKWPVIHSGFSGGAKKAALMSADLMTTGANVVGCFMSGVNEEYFVNGLNRVTKKSAAKRQYRRMAVFLCSGSTDEVATPAQHQSVEKKVKSAGIKATKIHTFEGGHNANWGVLPEAIEWILANCKDEFK